MIGFLNKLFAVPELSKYSDEQFDRLVIQAKVRRGDAIWVMPLLAGIGAAVAWTGVSLLLTWGLASVSNNPAASRTLNFGAMFVVVGVVLFFAAAAAVRWAMIVRSIRNIVNKAGCPFCDFSLVGLKVEYGKVKCPECGQDVFLHEERLTADDLMTDAQRYGPLPGAGETGAYLTAEERKIKRPASLPPKPSKPSAR